MKTKKNLIDGQNLKRSMSIKKKKTLKLYPYTVSRSKSVTYVPGIRYCMFMASSRILSLLEQIAAALKRIALTSDHPTPTQATTYDQSYDIIE